MEVIEWIKALAGPVATIIAAFAALGGLSDPDLLLPETVPSGETETIFI